MKRQLSTMLVLLVLSPFIVQAQTVTNCQYWIDSGDRTEAPISGDELAFNFDASNCAEGLHTLNYCVKDNEGKYSPLYTWMFLRKRMGQAPQDKKLVACQYWIDSGDRTEKTISNDEISFALDASNCAEGLHTLNYRVKDSEGMYSTLNTWVFLRKATNNSTERSVKSLEYWFDDNLAAVKRQSITGDTISFAIDATSLSEGLHRLNYRLLDDAGCYSPLQVWVFYKKDSKDTKTPKIAWYRYWWNNHVDKAVKETVQGDSTAFVFEKQLSVPDYAKDDGFSSNSTARFNIVFCDDQGHLSPLQAFDVEYPDELPPVTTIEADKAEATGSVTLTWKANESDIQDYNIYYSEDGLPFVLWLPNTTKTTSTFKGQAGKTYRFTVTARDKAGNRETYDEGKCVTVKFNTAN